MRAHDDAILNSHDTTAVQCAQGSILLTEYIKRNRMGKIISKEKTNKQKNLPTLPGESLRGRKSLSYKVMALGGCNNSLPTSSLNFAHVVESLHRIKQFFSGMIFLPVPQLPTVTLKTTHCHRPNQRGLLMLTVLAVYHAFCPPFSL